MSNITVNGESYEVKDGLRLVQAIEDAGINIGHRCGGYAKCTTCRVTFASGEPGTMTQAEYDKLGDNVGEFRLACQIMCEDGMDVAVLMTKESAGWEDSGPPVDAEVKPEAVFVSLDDLKAG